MDQIENVLEDQQGKLDNIVDKAADNIAEMVQNKKEALKEELPEINIDIDGKHWDLSHFLDRKAKKFTEYVNKKSAKFEKMLDRKMEQFPDKKDKLVDHLPGVINSEEPTDAEAILDKGINKFEKMLNAFTNDLSSQVDDMI